MNKARAFAPVVFATALAVSWSLFFLIYRLSVFDGAVDYDRYKRLLLPIDFLQQAPPPPPPERPERPQVLKRPDSPLPDKLTAGVPQPKLNVGNVPISDLIDTGSVGVHFGVGSEAVPVFRANPIYPVRAARRGIEGWVEVEFAITEDGGVDSVRVVKAQPESVFDSAALKAVSKWRYRPQTIEGRAVRREGERIVIEFQLEK